MGILSHYFLPFVQGKQICQNLQLLNHTPKRGHNDHQGVHITLNVLKSQIQKVPSSQPEAIKQFAGLFNQQLTISETIHIGCREGDNKKDPQ